jgi:hypothetical protein
VNYFKKNKLIELNKKNIIFINKIDDYIKTYKKEDKYKYNIIIKKIKEMAKNHSLIIFNGRYKTMNGSLSAHLLVERFANIRFIYV